MFRLTTLKRLATGLALRSNPLYVQFYITARCNLTCQQCNIIYANSDVRECTLAEIGAIAENLARIGVAIVLLTGGEPFLRLDLPDIVRAFVRNGIHVRMQTNGLAGEEALMRCVQNGACDMSISLDSLVASLQEKINGGFPHSWSRAIATVAAVSRHLPVRKSFAAFGCVLTPDNIEDVEDVVRFGTAIGWFTSLVPIHLTDRRQPMNFRAYDTTLAFGSNHYARVDKLIENLKKLKRTGFLLYDSDEYLDDIKRFVRGEPVTWRRKNDNICDSPGTYFAILPNGHWAVCCDHRLPGKGIPVYAPDFPKVYKSRQFQDRAKAVARSCPGCMFGSYPEITITSRYWEAMWERTRTFLIAPPPKPWPLSVERLQRIADEIRSSRGLGQTTKE